MNLVLRQVFTTNWDMLRLSPKNSAYNEMLYDDKIIQESINRDVERSIEHLREAYNHISQTGVNSIYFGYSYTSNQRYMIDSATLNIMADKLHRFFVPTKST